MINNGLKLTLALYLFCVSVILYLQPTLFFNGNDELKQFGIGKDKTLYPLWFIFMLMGFFSFYMVLIFFY